MPVTYRWKPGAQVRIDPQAAGEELETIREEHDGALTPEAVVGRAKSANSVLHEYFEWDDPTAAEAYRIEQAKYLIRSVEVVVDKPLGGEGSVRAFVSVVRGQDRSYTSVSHALSDAELRAQVLSQAWRELEAWRQRHAELIEFAAIFSAIDQARPATE